MNILIYTDGSKHKNKGVATSIVTSKDTFLGIVINTHYVTTSGEIELLAVLQGLQYILDSKINYQSISIYTDHESIPKILQQLLCGSDYRVFAHSYLWKKLLSLHTKMKFSIVHFKGHQDAHNLNKTCDFISSMGLHLDI